MSARSTTLVACALGILLSSSAFAGIRTLEWSPSAGATGYKLHYGDVSGGYSATVDVTDDLVSTGNGTLEYTTIDDFDDCTTWYFAVTAYNGVGESGYSNEASWLTPMTVNAATADDPGQLFMQGTQFAMTVSGAGFQPGATLEIDNAEWVCPDNLDPGDQLACDDLLADLRDTVRLESPTTDCNTIQALASIEPIALQIPALIGNYSVTVTNPGGESTAHDEAFEVLKDPGRWNIARFAQETDGRIDGGDVTYMLRLFLTCRAIPGTASMPCSDQQVSDDYDFRYDFNGDGWIDGDDLADLASFLGHCWDGSSWKVSACD